MRGSAIAVIRRSGNSHKASSTAGRLALAAFVLAVAAAGWGLPLHQASAADQIARGKYLVSLMSCTDCHTPGHFRGKEDKSKYLGGSDVGFGIPSLGVFVAPNLTPDKATGLGNWTSEQIATAITKGETPDGRILAPPMPWRNYANITKADALAIAAYLKSLAPLSNQTPSPFGPTQTPTTFVMTVLPGDVYAHIVNPPPPPPPASTAAPAPSAAPAPGSK
jgi:mono/diheme cytochrome c family protein